MSAYYRCLTPMGIKVHVTDEVGEWRPAGVHWTGETLCRAGVATLLVSFHNPDDRGVIGDDHRPVDCHRCRLYLELRAQVLTRILGGES